MTERDQSSLEEIPAVIEGSPEHLACIAEGRRCIVLRPDEPIPENPVL